MNMNVKKNMGNKFFTAEYLKKDVRKRTPHVALKAYSLTFKKIILLIFLIATTVPTRTNGK